jgi:hypothetical protein
MPRVFAEQNTTDSALKPAKYAPKAGDTLEKIASTHPDCRTDKITWQELAQYNWATLEPREVNRALIEILGSAPGKVDWASPEKTALDPAFAPSGGDKELLIPKLWKKDRLALAKTHIVKVRRPKPMPAVRITALSRWFIPETEACDISYSLEGVAERADKLSWEVWASRYQKAALSGPANDDLLEFAFSACDAPIRKESIADKKAPRPASDYTLNDWRGDSKAADGVLKPAGGQARYITVANSPYTVQFRFYKNDRDKDARIVLEAFWPRWKQQAASPPASPPAPELDPASLKVQWKVEKCSTLKHGQLLVWDAADRPEEPVLRKALGAADLSEGSHEFDWQDGKNVVRPGGMPYRVQIQAHTGIDEDNGVALAVAHTEVRLFAPPDLGTHADPAEDTQCFAIEMAPFVPDESVIAAGSTRWYQLQLAKVGLYPGPANGAAHDPYKIALRDFQRSYTKNAAAPFTRLKADGAENADTRAALSRVAAAAAPASPPASPPGPLSNDVARPMFGDRTRLDRPGEENVTTADINARLGDRAQDMIVWIDDRHYYTDTRFVAEVAAGRAIKALPDPNMGMENYRMSMDLGDGRVDRDAFSTARPWIPVCFGLPLLSKNDGLDRNSVPALTAAMRRAAGPLRVDWTFTDIGEDLTVIDTSRYSAQRLRSRLFVEQQVATLQGKHEGKVATNCPEAYGGCRPTPTSPPGDPPEEYYRKVFGYEAESLAPWRASRDTALHRIATLVHDDIGQDRAKVFPTLVGKAGVYLNPSRIAGDGYQFRARVCFEKLAGAFLYPNHEVLLERYARLPQAHTCKLRNWRKTSYRAYVGWAPLADRRWTPPAASPPAADGGWRHEMALDYRSGFVHFAYEPGARPELLMSALYTGAARNALLTLLETNSHNTLPRSPNLQFQADYMWPWSHMEDLGVRFAANPGERWDAFKARLLNRTYFRWADALVFSILQQIESQSGRLRGHVLVEFKGAPQPEFARYSCPTCATTYRYLEYTVGGAHSARTCPAPGCGGVNLALVSSAGPYDLVDTAMGLSLGASVLITLRDDEDFPWWTHEIGHNRHFEHAAGEGGNKPAQHDSVNNTADVALQADAGIGADWKRWDRVCTMSYTTSRQVGAAGGDDRQQFCGKCLLRNRGWRVEGLPNLGTMGGNVVGP